MDLAKKRQLARDAFARIQLQARGPAWQAATPARICPHDLQCFELRPLDGGPREYVVGFEVLLSRGFGQLVHNRFKLTSDSTLAQRLSKPGKRWTFARQAGGSPVLVTRTR